MKNSKNSKRLLNLNFLDASNKTYCAGKYDLPYVECNPPVLPDYIANYDEPDLYRKTSLTAVGFYAYDTVFDGPRGIYNAIYYDIPKRKTFYRKRFQDVKFMLAPDYTQAGDVPEWENRHRIARARIVSVWAAMEIGAIVIPNVTYASQKSFDYMLDGMENCRVVSFSLTGVLSGRESSELFKSAVKLAVDRLPLKAIVVFVTSKNEWKIHRLFEYAIQKGINVAVPDNTLLLRSQRKRSA